MAFKYIGFEHVMKGIPETLRLISTFLFRYLRFFYIPPYTFLLIVIIFFCPDYMDNWTSIQRGFTVEIKHTNHFRLPLGSLIETIQLST
jgi:hypothetical protein